MLGFLPALICGAGLVDLSFGSCSRRFTAFCGLSLSFDSTDVSRLSICAGRYRGLCDPSNQGTCTGLTAARVIDSNT